MSDGEEPQRVKKPKPTLLQRVVRRLQLLYFQYEVCLGAYVFEWWEKIFIFFIFASVFAVIAAAVYKQTATVLAYATWHWTHHASKWEVWRQLGFGQGEDPAPSFLSAG